MAASISAGPRPAPFQKLIRSNKTRSFKWPSVHNLDGLHHALVLMIEDVTVQHELSLEILVPGQNPFRLAFLHDQRVAPDVFEGAIRPRTCMQERVDMDVERMPRVK